jgi:hypothetical protein
MSDLLRDGHRWRITYGDLSGETKYYEVVAGSDQEAVETFREYVAQNRIALRLPTIGEHEGQPVLGLSISVLSDGVWVDPGSVGL